MLPAGRLASLAALVATAAALSACGDSSSGSLEKPLSYVSPDSRLVLVASTDLDDDRYDELNGDVGKRLLGDGLKDTAEKYVKEAGLSFGDVEDVLGNDLVLAFETGEEPGVPDSSEESVLAVLEVRDVGKARDFLEEFDVRKSGEIAGADLYGEEGDLVAIDGDVVVFSDSRTVLERALRRADGSGGLTPRTLEEAGEGLGPTDSILRAYANPRALLKDPALRRFQGIEWVAALRSAALTVDLDGNTLKLRAAANTDPAGLSPADLPLAPGGSPPPLAELAGRLASATGNQSQTTAWLLKAVRAAYPDSAFVRDVAEVERDLDIDFEREFLRQFDGPSTSTLAPDGTFAARSTVADPVRLGRLMKRLAPRLPKLLVDLQALDTEGLIALFLIAPDAPIATRTFREGKIAVTDLGTGLYEVRGLEAPAPRELVFGLVGDVFVVASDQAKAREIATARVRPAGGLEGASVAKGDLRGFDDLTSRFGLPPVGGDAKGWVDVTPSRLSAGADVELMEPRGE